MNNTPLWRTFTDPQDRVKKEPAPIFKNQVTLKRGFPLQFNFGFEKIEDFLTSKRNYLFKIIKYSKEQYLEINKDRILFVKDKKEQFITKIEELEKIKNEI